MHHHLSPLKNLSFFSSNKSFTVTQKVHLALTGPCKAGGLPLSAALMNGNAREYINFYFYYLTKFGGMTADG